MLALFTQIMAEHCTNPRKEQALVSGLPFWLENPTSFVFLQCSSSCSMVDELGHLKARGPVQLQDDFPPPSF